MARSVIIGDVHGCSAELSALLDRVQPGDGDQVFFVGDLVGRGPDTPGVLSIVRQVAGRSVVGNHEAQLLSVRRAPRQGQQVGSISRACWRLLHQLKDEDWGLLESLVAFIELPEHSVCIVHAGVLPGVSVAHQQLRVLTTMRSIGPGGVPLDVLHETSWAAHHTGPPHVVFGHAATAGLQVYSDATGLDSGCVYGGRLTALVLEQGRTPPPADLRGDVLVSVPARHCYYPRTVGGQ